MIPADLESKSFDALTEDEIIYIHITGTKMATKDYVVMSTLDVMESEARHAICYNNSQVFLPLLASFAILDQIGQCYADATMPAYPNSDASGIKKAAYYFLSFQPNDMATKTLYALRNGVMHDASFVTHTVNKEHYWFRFDSKMPEFLRVASNAWDGSHASRCDTNCSLLNPKAFIDRISSMMTRIRTMHKDGKLKLTLDGGKDELKQRYLHGLEIKKTRS